MAGSPGSAGVVGVAGMAGNGGLLVSSRFWATGAGKNDVLPPSGPETTGVCTSTGVGLGLPLGLKTLIAGPIELNGSELSGFESRNGDVAHQGTAADADRGRSSPVALARRVVRPPRTAELLRDLDRRIVAVETNSTWPGAGPETSWMTTV